MSDDKPGRDKSEVPPSDSERLRNAVYEIQRVESYLSALEYKLDVGRRIVRYLTRMYAEPGFSDSADFDTDLRRLLAEWDERP